MTAVGYVIEAADRVNEVAGIGTQIQDKDEQAQRDAMLAKDRATEAEAHLVAAVTEITGGGGTGSDLAVRAAALKESAGTLITLFGEAQQEVDDLVGQAAQLESDIRDWANSLQS